MGNINMAIPAPPDAIFDLKFHQIAIHHPAPLTAVNFWKNAGYYNWLPECAFLKGLLHGKPFEVYVDLYFNYELWPHEMEYIRWSTGAPLCPDQEPYGRRPFISHWAAYVDDLDMTLKDIEEDMGLKPCFHYVTVEHQNPALRKSGERFYECLIDTRELLGHDIKLIQRVHENDIPELLKRIQKDPVPV